MAELQRERKERMFALVDPLHMQQWEWGEQLGYSVEHSVDKFIKFWSKWPYPAVRPVDGGVSGCQMPLTKNASCRDFLVRFTTAMTECRAPVGILVGM